MLWVRCLSQTLAVMMILRVPSAKLSSGAQVVSSSKMSPSLTDDSISWARSPCGMRCLRSMVIMICCGGGTYELWGEFYRSISTVGDACRSGTQGRKARRVAGHASYQGGAGDQPHNREDARPHCPADAARACRRGN